MIAVADEAMVHQGQPGYVLAAVLLADDRRAVVRSAAQRIVPRRRRFHWHQEEPREKRAMMQLVGAEAMAAHALVVSPCATRRREPSRQRLLLELAVTLACRPAVELTIESRGQHNDRLDRRTLVQARHDGLIPEDMAYVHRQPGQEPLLWLADALAGAARSGALLHDRTWLDRLPSGLLTIRRVTEGPALAEAR